MLEVIWCGDFYSLAAGQSVDREDLAVDEPEERAITEVVSFQ